MDGFGVNQGAPGIHYQSGGQPSSFCLAIIDTANRAVMVGEYERAANDLQELRRMIRQRLFIDGRGC